MKREEKKDKTASFQSTNKQSMLRHTNKHACNQDFLKRGDLEVKIFCLKNASIGWRTEQSGATQSFHIDGGLGANPSSAGQFFDFSRKSNCFNTIWIPFRTFLKLFERIKLLRFRSQ